MATGEFMKKLTLLAAMLLTTSTFGAEADHYTGRNDFLADISENINSRSNMAVEEAVDSLKGLDCSNKESEIELYKELQKTFANHTKGDLVIKLLVEKSIEKRAIPLNESIFGEWSVLNGYLLGKKSAANSPLALSPLIRVGDRYIGIDKMEHMFGMGYRYFKKHHLKGKKLHKVLKGGIFSEKTVLGGNILATGVFSYGDLSANFNGMRFWNHVLQRRDDVLGKKHNIGPYVTCNDGRFSVNKENPIDFKNYVDHSMDESINCSKLATKSAAKKYKKAIDDRGFKCPMSNESLEKIKAKYDVVIKTDRKKRSISHWIINDEGIEDVSYFNEF